jgi:HEAT repeat protein
MRWGIAWVIGLLFLVPIGCKSRAPYEGKSAAQLEKMLTSTDPKTQAQGAYGLSRLEPSALRSVTTLPTSLATALRSPDVLVRQNAALALGAMGPDAAPALLALTEALKDASWTVRRQAAQALGQMGPAAQTAVPALQELAQDPDQLVRKAAEQSVQKLAGSPGA